MKQAVPCPAIYDNVCLAKGMIIRDIYPGMPMDLPHVGQECMWRNFRTKEGGTGKVHSVNFKEHTYTVEVLHVFTNV